MEKQDLQAGESKWQNSNFTLEQKTLRYESRKMVLNHAKIRLKNNRSILG